MKPIKFIPQYKSVIWGGREIASFKGTALTRDDIGESWEISGLPGRESIVAEGEYKGMKLHDLLRIHGRDIMGERLFRQHGTVFPLLLKIIDAHMDLSIGVHPDDRMARSNGYHNGKTEMWYLVECRPGAKIYAGFKNNVTHDEICRMISDNTLTEAIASFDSTPGDIVMVPAGRIHAIGAGNLLVEIQQTSDISYRLYDYDRRDADGNPRALHIDEALIALNLETTDDSRLKPTAGALPGEDILASCEHFLARRIIVDGSAILTNPDDSFLIAICISGAITITTTDGSDTTLVKGESTLIPAVNATANLSGNGTILVFSA